MMDEKDRQYKEKMADEGGSSKEHNFVVGDHVLLRQRKRDKWSTPYEPVFYTVIEIRGSAITPRRITDGREVQRYASQFKLANVLMYQEKADEGGQGEECRETILMSAGDMKDQPICQMDVEQENLLELPEERQLQSQCKRTSPNRVVVVAVNRKEEQEQGFVRKWICQARQSKTLLCHPVVPQGPVDRKGPGDDLHT